MKTWIYKKEFTQSSENEHYSPSNLHLSPALKATPPDTHLNSHPNPVIQPLISLHKAAKSSNRFQLGKHVYSFKPVGLQTPTEIDEHGVALCKMSQGWLRSLQTSLGYAHMGSCQTEGEDLL